MGKCFLCEPPVQIADEGLGDHLWDAHDIRVEKVVEKWPDGEWVIHDETLEPGDFEGPDDA